MFLKKLIDKIQDFYNEEREGSIRVELELVHIVMIVAAAVFIFWIIFKP